MAQTLLRVLAAVPEADLGQSRPLCQAVHGGWRLTFPVSGHFMRQVLELLNALLPPNARKAVWNIIDEQTAEAISHWCATVTAELSQSRGDTNPELTAEAMVNWTRRVERPKVAGPTDVLTASWET